MVSEGSGTGGRSSSQKRLNARDIELAAFTEVGRHDLGGRIWDEASEAAERAWRECRAGLREEYGARNPHWGWSVFVLLTAALCAAVAAVMTSGFRFDPAETMVAVTVLVAIAGLMDLVVGLASRARPVNAGFLRPQVVVAIGLGAAAAFQLSRGVTSVTMVFVVAAVIGVGGLVLFILMRALRPAEREEIDSAVNVSIDRKQPEVDAAAARIQAAALADLSAQEQERIVALRTSRLGDTASGEVPAGGMIISEFLSAWNPYLKD